MYSGETNGARGAFSAAAGNREPSGSKPGPKSAHSHAPYKAGGGSPAGGGSKKASTPSKTGANKNPLR